MNKYHWYIFALKRQHNLAQGKRRRSVALGLIVARGIVRVMMLIKENFLFRTKEMISIFHGNNFMQFPDCGWQASEMCLSLFSMITRGRFFIHLITQGVALG